MDSCLSIDIGQYSIKVSEVEPLPRGSYKLIRFREFIFQTQTVSDQRLEAATFLREVAQSCAGRDVRIVWGASQRAVSLRRCMFPFKERHKIAKSVAFELEDEIPFSYDNAIFDTRIVRYVGNEAEVLAMASPKTHIQEQLDWAADSHLEPDILSVEGLAVANLFVDWESAPPQEEAGVKDTSLVTDVVLNIGHKKTTAVLLSGYRILDVRVVSWGGHHLIEHTSNALSMPYKETFQMIQAEALLCTPEAALPDHKQKMCYAIYQSLEELSKNLKLTLVETQSRIPVKYKHIHLAGGLARLPHIAQHVSGHLGIPAGILQEQSASGFVNKSGVKNVILHGGVSIGLAIEGLRKPRNPALNLLQGEYSSQKQGFQLFWQSWGAVIRASSIVFVCVIMYAFLRNQGADTLSNKSYDRMKAHAKKTAGLRGTRASLSSVKRYIKTQKKLKKSLVLTKELLSVRTSMDVLKELSSTMPGKKTVDLNITEFIAEGDYLKITGEVKKPAQLRFIRKSLLSVSATKKLKKEVALGPPRTGWTSFSWSTKVQSPMKKGVRR